MPRFSLKKATFRYDLEPTHIVNHQNILRPESDASAAYSPSLVQYHRRISFLKTYRNDKSNQTLITSKKSHLNFKNCVIHYKVTIWSYCNLVTV